MSQVQVGDEGPHQARLADACSQCETERWEVPLEIRDGRILALDQFQSYRDCRRFARWNNLGDPMKDLKRMALGWAEAEASGNGVNVAVHEKGIRLRSSALVWDSELLSSLPKSELCHLFNLWGGWAQSGGTAGYPNDVSLKRGQFLSRVPEPCL